jgi:hypothetical protein
LAPATRQRRPTGQGQCSDARRPVKPAKFLFTSAAPSGILRGQHTLQKGFSAEISVTRQTKLMRDFYARLLWLLPAGLLVSAANGRAQEALRISMSGDLAAAMQQQSASSIGYYNLLLGPTAWRFSSGLGIEYNDNVRLQSSAAGNEGDFILRPSLNVQLHWPVTLKNSLDVSVAAGYSEYFEHPELSQFFINPGSGFAFNVYAGDFRINFHDRVAVTQQAYQNAGVSGGNRDLVSLQNTAGIGALWDLDKAIANVGYDHVNYVSLSQNQGEPDASSENLFINSGVRVRPELLLGVEAGGSVITYNQTSQANMPIADATQWSMGAFGTAQVSEYISARLDCGYTVYTPESSSASFVATDTSGIYFALSVSHRVNQFFSYTLAAGRNTDLAAYGQAQSYYFVRLTPAWNLFRKYSLSTPLWWQDGTRIYNTRSGGDAHYQQIGAGVTVSRALTRKLSGSLGYQFVEESSDEKSLNYTVNTVDLNFTYQF